MKLEAIDSMAPFHCQTSQYGRSLASLLVSRWNDLSHPVFGGVGFASFKNSELTLRYLFQTPSLWCSVYILAMGCLSGFVVCGIGVIQCHPPLHWWLYCNNK